MYPLLIQGLLKGDISAAESNVISHVRNDPAGCVDYPYHPILRVECEAIGPD
jgi:hypothetical protein